VTDYEIPASCTVQLPAWHAGDAGLGHDDERVRGTVRLLRHRDRTAGAALSPGAGVAIRRAICLASHRTGRDAHSGRTAPSPRLSRGWATDIMPGHGTVFRPGDADEAQA
jgi:hypothetical protein